MSMISGQHQLGTRVVFVVFSYSYFVSDSAGWRRHYSDTRRERESVIRVAVSAKVTGFVADLASWATRWSRPQLKWTLSLVWHRAFVLLVAPKRVRRDLWWRRGSFYFCGFENRRNGINVQFRAALSTAIDVLCWSTADSIALGLLLAFIPYVVQLFTWFHMFYLTS